MPIDTKELRLSSGRWYVRCEVSGHVSGEEASALFQRVSSVNAREGSNTAILSIVAAQTAYSPESRRVFTGELNGAMGACAVVVTSAIVRSAINFMVRVRGDGNRVRFFSAEPEALEWLENPK